MQALNCTNSTHNAKNVFIVILVKVIYREEAFNICTKLKFRYIYPTYGSRRLIFQFLFPISIKQGYTMLECPFSTAVNDNTDWNICPRFPYTTDLQHTRKNKEPNPTGNVSLTLDTKRRLVALA